jgi:RNA polymerase sigma-70 factor (ECF subfamily)
VDLYDVLLSIQPSPVVALNRAVAVSKLDGPLKGLQLIEELRDELAEYTPFHAARADFLRRAGRIDEARRVYTRAIELAENGVERRYFERRVKELSKGPDRVMD